MNNALPEPEVPSPCVDICRLNHQDMCIGCFRSRGEIAQWTALTAEQKREVIEACRIRRDTLGNRSGRDTDC